MRQERYPREGSLLRRFLTLAIASAIALLAFGAPGSPAAAQHADRDGNKVFDALDNRLARTAAGERVPVIVSLRAPATQARVDELSRYAEGIHEKRRFTIVDAFAAELTPAQVRSLARRADVAHIEEDLPIRASNATAQASFGVTKARLDSGLDGDRDGSVGTYSRDDLVAAVVDTGIDTGHADLDGGKVIAFASCLNARCAPAAPVDPNGHGTHVAATIAGDGDGRGDRLHRGVAPAAALVGLRVLDAEGAGSLSNFVAAMQWIVANRAAHGIDVVNASLGTSGCHAGTDAASAAVNSAVAAGLVVVASAGNDGPGSCTVGIPGVAAGAITVGAMADLGRQGFRLASFSSRGPTLDGRTKPDVVGPGVGIISARAGTATGYSTQSGTSVSAPFVAGVALLMLAANPALAPAEVKARLRTTAIDWGAAGPDHEYGAGRLDGYAALAAAGSALTAPPAVPSHLSHQGSLPATGASVDLPLTVTRPGFPLAATLVAPGWVTASQSPNFDLQLLNGNGVVVASGATGANAERPALRRHEELSLPNAPTGSYTLRVVSAGGGGTFVVDVSGGLAHVPIASAPAGSQPVGSPAPAPQPTIGSAQPADRKPPVVRALAGAGRLGTVVKLRYRVSDNSGRARERVRLFRGTKLIRTFDRKIGARRAGRNYAVSWRAARKVERLRFCVRAWDAAGNASGWSCAPLQIRR